MLSPAQITEKAAKLQHLIQSATGEGWYRINLGQRGFLRIRIEEWEVVAAEAPPVADLTPWTRLLEELLPGVTVEGWSQNLTDANHLTLLTLSTAPPTGYLPDSDQ